MRNDGLNAHAENSTDHLEVLFIHIYIYTWQEMYFHWSEDDQTGSEHTINNQPFPAEIQVDR